MRNKDLHDLLGGLIMLAISAFAAIYAYINLDLGSLRSMGRGSSRSCSAPGWP